MNLFVGCTLALSPPDPRACLAPTKAYATFKADWITN